MIPKAERIAKGPGKGKVDVHTVLDSRCSACREKNPHPRCVACGKPITDLSAAIEVASIPEVGTATAELTHRDCMIFKD